MAILVWFRNDLRVHDHSALSAALARGEAVIGIFCYTPQQWQAHDWGDNKIGFIHAHVAALREQLQTLQIPLLLPVLTDYAASVAAIVSTAQQYACTAVYWNVEYEINERQRDRDCVAALAQQDIRVQRFTDHSVVHPAKIQTGNGDYYKVFTPFKRAWIRYCQEHELPAKAQPIGIADSSLQAGLKLTADPLPQQLDGYNLHSAALADWSIGEDAAQEMLLDFINEKVADYTQQRDLPDVAGTSRLSAYLAAGVISVRQCLRLALQANEGHFSGVSADGRDGVATWISELIWREYYRHVVFGFPHVCRGHAFKRHTDQLCWEDNPTHFSAWCAGRTGIPIVDAGMRQLVQTGWMHNRVRMIVAMFLSKNLFLNWRSGERFFNQHLCDADFAANNGGWQWSASTGTDAAPYFRIFNPYSQGKRFDPQAAYIKNWVPELRDVEVRFIHEPEKWSAAERAGVAYPAAVVDCKKTRAAAIAAFKDLAS